jgi:hypothetical protein
MSSDQFLSAVRCTAYEAMVQPNAALGEVKMQLNAEALHQSAETAAEARSEASRIARQAVISESGADRAMVAQTACAGAQLAIHSAASDAA